MPAARLVRRHASPSGSGTSCPTAKHASPGSVGKPPRLAAAVLVLRRRRHHALPCESGGTPRRVVASPSGGGTPCQAAAAATPLPAATVPRLARRRAGGGSCAILCRARPASQGTRSTEEHTATRSNTEKRSKRKDDFEKWGRDIPGHDQEMTNGDVDDIRGRDRHTRGRDCCTGGARAWLGVRP